MWLLLLTLINIYNEKKEVEKMKIQNSQFEEGWSIRKWDSVKSYVLGENRFLKKKLILN